MTGAHESDAARRRERKTSSTSDMSMMRVAIAGTGGLARLIAHYINETTIHQVVFLSRLQHPDLVAAGYQVAVVDYNNAESLQYALRGTDTVISTINGVSQVSLIHAAASVRVRRFAPSEFEGLPQLRSGEDVLDRSKALAARWLAHYAPQMQATVFCCGIFYERFQPGGMTALGLGSSSGVSGEGQYIMDCGRMIAQAPVYNAQGEANVTIVMTAVQDVAQFVTKALDLPSWPAELRMWGTRLQVKDLIALVEQLRGQRFNPIGWHSPATLRAELQSAAAQQDNLRLARLRALVNTAEGRYDFNSADLNQRFPEVTTIDFRRWFRAKWQSN